MRIVLKNYDITKIGYNVNGYQDKPTQDINNVIYGSSNKERSKMTFNLNLIAILGLKKFKNEKTINIKVVGIKAIFENNQNIIDSISEPVLRTSNIYMSSKNLTFLNNKNKNLIGIFTNYNPNEEIFIDNIYFHRDDGSDFLHYYDIRFRNTSVFVKIGYDDITSSINSLLRYKMICPNVSVLHNKIMRGSMFKVQDNNNLYFMNVVDSNDGSLPIRVPFEFVNQFVAIQVLPENNQWYHKRFDNIYEDDSNIELTTYMPNDYNLE